MPDRAQSGQGHAVHRRPRLPHDLPADVPTAGEDLATSTSRRRPTTSTARCLTAQRAAGRRRQHRPCAVVSTFSTRNVRDLELQARSAPTAPTAWPAPPRPRSRPAAADLLQREVIPDPSQPVSSDDGGVVWTGVPTGVYTICAHHPTSRFASFVATCKAGRIVNANPPWGLYELGLANRTAVSAAWTGNRAPLTLRSLRATGLPQGAVLRLSVSRAALSLPRAFGQRHRHHRRRPRSARAPRARVPLPATSWRCRSSPTPTTRSWSTLGLGRRGRPWP